MCDNRVKLACVTDKKEVVCGKKNRRGHILYQGPHGWLPATATQLQTIIAMQ